MFKELKVTGSIDFEGAAVPDESDAIRVYYGFTNQWGERWEGPVATGFLEVGETSLEGALVSGSADLAGMLTVATCCVVYTSEDGGDLRDFAGRLYMDY